MFMSRIAAATATLAVVNAAAPVEKNFLQTEFSAEEVLKAGKNRPVAKVITLLKDMQAQLEKDAEADQEIYDKISCWCKINNKDKTAAIKEQEEAIERYTSEIEMHTATIAQLTAEIEQGKKEVAENSASLAKATELREKQLSEFNAEEKEMLQTIQALKNAIVVLSKHHSAKLFMQAKEKDSEENKPALLAVKAVAKIFKAHREQIVSQLSPDENASLQQFIQQAVGQPTVAKYTAQSGQIFGILKQMQEQFEADLSSSQKTEQANAATFGELKTAKESEIAAGQKQVDDKEMRHANTVEALATAKQDLVDTQNSLSADDEYLRMVNEKCATTDKEWEERQKARAEEISAVSQAIQILSSDDAHDTFTRNFNNGVQFIQTSIINNGDKSLKAIVAKKIDKVAKKVGQLLDPKNRKQMALVATSVKLDAFEKVKAAIDEMVVQLTKEKEEEIEHRDFCISEINLNEKNTATADRTKEQAQAAIDELKAEIAGFKDQIETLKKEIEESQTALKRATEDRAAENKDFQATLADQLETQKLLEQAVTVLTRVYTQHQTPVLKLMQIREANMQQPAEESDDPIRNLENMKGSAAPGQFDTYQQNAGSGGVIALLRQIISDTKMMEQELRNAETEAEKQFLDLQSDTKKNVAVKGTEITNTESNLARQEATLGDEEANLKDAVLQLEDLSNENGSLHAQCDFILKNFEVRQQARDEEIEALGQAKAILSGMSMGDVIANN